MITLKNTQRNISIDRERTLKTIRGILEFLKYENFDIGVWFTTNRTIQNYNKIYRNKNKPTDILSFSYHSYSKPGQRIKPSTPDDANLGDLIISPAYIHKSALGLQQNFADRLDVLLVHGILHLIGYDHEKDEDYKIMHRKELEILRNLKKNS